MQNKLELEGMAAEDIQKKLDFEVATLFFWIFNAFICILIVLKRAINKKDQPKDDDFNDVIEATDGRCGRLGNCDYFKDEFDEYLEEAADKVYQ